MKELPPLVETALRAAGWKRGVTRKANYRVQGIEPFPEAIEILSELFGLTVRPLPGAGRDLPGNRVRFDPSIAQGYEEEIQLLAGLIQASLYPLGEVDSAIAILLLADTGHCFLLAYAEFGVLFGGASFGETMSRILEGHEKQVAVIPNDSEGRFNIPELLEGRSLPPWVVPESGLPRS